MTRFGFSFHAAVAATVVALGCANAAQAHVVLQDPAAAAGSSYRATFRIGHGCGDSPTTGMRISIPAGFNGAQPMPKAGWTLTTQTGKLEQPYEAHGKTFTEGVVEVQWTAKSAAEALPAAYYDEFVLRGTTPKKPGVLWFKVVQTCEKGSNAWVEIPSKGVNMHDLKFPAAPLDVLDVQAAGGHHH